MHKKFASIANSAKYGYCVDTDAWKYDSRPFLSQAFRMFETYGDGLCQHSTDWPVSEEFAIDYLFSLAAVLLEDEALAYQIESKFHVTVRQDLLDFAAGLIFDPEKDKEWNKKRYYSISLQKVTRNREKEHDNLYKELNEYQNGTPESIFALVKPEYCYGLEAWQIADAVRTYVNDRPKMRGMEMPAVYLKWFESAKTVRGSQSDQYALARLFRDAFDACQWACDSHRDRKRATREVEQYREHLEYEAKQEAEQEALASLGPDVADGSISASEAIAIINEAARTESAA